MIGACQLFRRQTYYFVGGLDEWYFYGPEDVDFCLKIREAGMRVQQITSAGCAPPAPPPEPPDVHPAGHPPRGGRAPLPLAAQGVRAEGHGPGVTLTDFASVTVAYRSADVIGEVVDSLTELPGCSEVVVVDNGDDGSGSLAEAGGASVIRRPDNPGFGTAVNAAVAATTGDAVLIVNPDASVDPAGVAAGLAHLRANPSVAMVQGVIRNRATGEPERSMGDELDPRHLWGRALGARRVLATRGRSAAGAGRRCRRPRGPRARRADVGRGAGRHRGAGAP